MLYLKWSPTIKLENWLLPPGSYLHRTLRCTECSFISFRKRKIQRLAGHAGDLIACARLSDSICSGNVLKAKLRRALLGKGGGGGGKNGRDSLLAFL